MLFRTAGSLKWQAMPVVSAALSVLTAALMLSQPATAETRSAANLSTAFGDRPRAITSSRATPAATPGCELAWRVVSSPDLPSYGSRLSAVAAVAPDDVWGVGAPIIHWDGTEWTAVETFINIDILDVAAVSSSDVWAVGRDRSSAQSRPSTIHWDGVQWTRVPNPGPTNYGLQAVAAVGPNDVWAVGGGLNTLIMRWNGLEWTVVPSPNFGAYTNDLTGVAAVGTGDVWAVGNYRHTSGGPSQTLVMHWDGAIWSAIPSPNASGQNYLNAVSAVSTNDVWAVGRDGVTSQPLTMHWNGTQWSVVPNGSSLDSGSLGGVTAVAADDVWAVGSNGAGTLIMRWDGAQWSVVPSSNPESGPNALTDVAAISASDVWAVGDSLSDPEYIYRAFTQRYSDPCANPTSTPTQTPSHTHTSTATTTAINTPTATSTACAISPDYALTVSTGATIVPASSYVPGSTCGACTVSVALPFSYSFYGTPYSQMNISNNGVVQFSSDISIWSNRCLPYARFANAIFAYWDNHNTNINDAMGIFTSTTGTAPNRIFNIEWRSGYVANDTRSNFQVRLYEGQPRFDVIYANTRQGFSATIGVQKGPGERFTQYACDLNNSVPNGTRITFDQRVCAGASPGSSRKP